MIPRHSRPEYLAPMSIGKIRESQTLKSYIGNRLPRTTSHTTRKNEGKKERKKAVYFQCIDDPQTKRGKTATDAHEQYLELTWETGK